MVVVADQAVRIDRMDVIIELRHPPVEGYSILLVIPVSVKPQGTGMVLGEQFLHLCLHEFEIMVVVLPVSLAAGESAGFTDREVLAVPVQDGIVELEFYALFEAGFVQVLYHIMSVRGGLHDVVVRSLGIEH